MNKILKIFSLFTLTALVVSCSDSVISDENDVVIPSKELSTEVSLNGTRMAVTNTVAFNGTSEENAYFFIRIDNRIPGCGSFNPSLYFPQTKNGRSLFNDMNKGKVNTTKEGVTWKTLNSDGITSYLYDTTGKTTIEPLTSIPSLDDILKANENSSYNTSEIDTDTLHVIWYVTKYESGIWHVDGVLTGKSTANTDSIPNMDTDKNGKMDNDAIVKVDTVNNIVVDIHQQEHKDWGEIKTSVHLRDTTKINKITITLPIDSSYVIEKDDFAVRQWKEYFSLKNENGEISGEILDSIALSVNVTHTASAIIYEIVCDPKYIKQCMEGESKDGITIEIHTYTKIDGDKKKEVWEMLKNSTTNPLIKDGDFTISSALYE